MATFTTDDIAEAIRKAEASAADIWVTDGRFNRYTLAILLHYKMPFRRNTDGAAAFLNRFAMYPLCEPDAPEMAVIAAVNEQLHRSTNPDG